MGQICERKSKMRGGKTMVYVLLAIAILCEIGASSMLKATQGFTVPAPSVATVVLYLSSFFLFSKVLTQMDLATAYATWCAAGIVATSIISVVAFGDHLTPMAVFGLALCVAGVVIVNLSATA
jgi:small multidrug resistance pump